MLELVAALALASAAPDETAVLLRDSGEPALSIHHEPGPGPAVLYVHGATFPAALSVAYCLDGKSWADDLHARGFDVWSFDFAGYGGSDRPTSMQQGRIARDNVPGRAADAAHQIERVVRYIRKQTHHPRVSIIAHSWGTIPAGLFAGTHSGWIDRLVLFGPVAQRNGRDRGAPFVAPATLVNASDQWNSFQSGIPKDQASLISKERFELLGKGLPRKRSHEPGPDAAERESACRTGDGFRGGLEWTPAL